MYYINQDNLNFIQLSGIIMKYAAKKNNNNTEMNSKKNEELQKTNKVENVWSG